MPGFVARAGLAHRQVPLNELGTEIALRIRKGLVSAGGLVKSTGAVL
jgi:hypothetical protein